MFDLNHMPKLNQCGVIQFIILLILLVGIAGIVYLVTAGPLKISPKASIGNTENSLSLVAYAKGGIPVIYPQADSSISTAVGKEFMVDVLVKTSTESANLISAKLKFDKDILQIVDNGLEINTSAPFIVKTTTEAMYKNDQGTVSIIGGIPNPGYESEVDRAGLLARLTFKVLKESNTTKISFTNGTAMYKNSDGTEIGLVIQRDLAVKVSSTADQGSGQEVAVSFTVRGGEPARENYLPFSIIPNITPKELLDQTGCGTYLLTFEGNPNMNDYQNQQSVVRIEYWYPPVKDPKSRPLEKLDGGKTYQVRCEGKSYQKSFTLKGVQSSMPSLKPGQQYIALPYGYTKPAKEFLTEISNDMVVCTDVQKLDNNQSQLIQVYTTARQTNIPSVGNQDTVVSSNTGYNVVCFSRQDPFLAKYVDWSRYSKDISKASSSVNQNIPSASLAPTPVPSTVPAVQQSGDINRDGKINLSDLSRFFGQFNQRGTLAADLNGDGVVNSFDYPIIRGVLIENNVIEVK